MTFLVSVTFELTDCRRSSINKPSFMPPNKLKLFDTSYQSLDIDVTTPVSEKNLVFYDQFTWLLLTAFVLSGVCMPLLIMILTENGGTEPTTFLGALPGSLGQCLGIFINPVPREPGIVEWKLIIAIALLEALSQGIVLDGLMLAGSAIYTVAYSSIVAYTAVLSMYFVNRRLNYLQWTGVITVMIGLGLVAMDAKSNGSDVYLGFFLVLLGSFSHSLTYVGSEYVMTLTSEPIRPEYLSFLLGSIGSSLNLTWQLFYTLPNANTLIFDNIELHNGSSKIIVTAYLLLVISSAVHAYTFYHLLSKIGSITTGLCKGVQSVLVFVASHFIFCSSQKAQCFSSAKGASLVIVLLGVTLYSIYSDPHGSVPTFLKNSKDSDRTDLTADLEDSDTSPYQATVSE